MKSSSAFIWNMIGSACYSISSMLYLIIVTRICGAEEAGFFSLSYATAQLLLTIGRYGMRTYQATDLRGQYSYREYLLSRVISVGIMLLLGLGYSLYAFDGKYIGISILVVGMKAIDAVEDVYHGRLQQTGHVEQMGKSQAARNVFTPLVFTVMLLITKNLLLTLIVTVSTSLLFCIVMNQRMIALHTQTDEIECRLSGASIAGLLKNCTGIFVGTFLSLLVYNIPKYAMDGVLNAEYQTYYSILFMPAFVVTLLCEFVFKPTITSIAGYWLDADHKRFNRSILTLTSIVAVGAVLITLAGHFIGRFLLELLYGVDLKPFKLHFIVLLLGGGVSACAYLVWNTLIAIRRGGSIKIVYSIVCVLCAIAVVPMVRSLGMMGAALNFLLSQSLLFLFFGAILLKICKEK